jgi:hypothetical protein
MQLKQLDAKAAIQDPCKTLDQMNIRIPAPYNSESSVSEFDPAEFLNLVSKESSLLSQRVLNDELGEDQLPEDILLTDSVPLLSNK